MGSPDGSGIVAVETATDVERWVAVSPRDHARRIVVEVIRERMYRDNMAGFRVRYMLGISQSPAEFRHFAASTSAA